MTKRAWQGVDLAVVGLGAALVVFFAGAAVVLAVQGSAPTAFWAAGGAVSGGLLGLLTGPPGEGRDRAKIAADVACGLTHAAAVRAALAAAQAQGADQRESANKAVAAVRSRGVLALEDVQSRVTKGAAHGTAAQTGADEVGRTHRAAAEDAARVLQQQTERLVGVQAEQAQGADNQPDIKAAQDAVGAAGATSAVLAAAAAAADQEKLEATGSGITAAATASSSATPRATPWVLFAVFCLLLALGVVLASGMVGLHNGFAEGPTDNLTKTVVALASAAGTGVIGLYVPSPAGKGTVPSVGK